MEKYIADYIDLAVMVTAVVLTTFLSLRWVKTAVLPVRVLPFGFLLFGPVLIGSAMAGHLFEISFKAAKTALNSNFVFTYHFYSLMLMGIVFLAMAGYMLQQIKIWASGNSQGKENFIKTALILAVLSAPSYFFAPIGLLPTLASLISFAALPFTRKPTPKKELVLQ